MFCTIYSVIYVFNFLTDFGIQAKQVIRHSIMLSVSTTCEIWCELETNTSDSEFPGITVHRAVSSRHSGNIMWQQRDIGFLLWLEGSGGIRFLKKITRLHKVEIALAPSVGENWQWYIIQGDTYIRLKK